MYIIAINVVREKLRSKAIYVVASLGVVLMLLISTGDGLSINGIKVITFEQRIPVAIALNTFIGSLVAIITSLQTIPNEIERKTTHLILSRGVSAGQYMFSLTLGNMLTAFIGMFSINLSLLAVIIILGRPDLFFITFASILMVTVNTIALSAIVSLLSIYVPFLVNALIGISIYLMGVLHNLISTFANALEGPAGKIISSIMRIMPNFASVQNQASNMLTGNAIDFQGIIWILCFTYIALTLTFFGIHKEV